MFICSEFHVVILPSLSSRVPRCHPALVVIPSEARDLYHESGRSERFLVALLPGMTNGRRS